MMNRGKGPVNHVGFTPEQMELAIMLFNTQMEAPYTIRTGNSIEDYKLVKIIGKTSPISFAEPGSGKYALKSHEGEGIGKPLSPIFINLRKLPKELYDQIAEAMRATVGVIELAAGKIDYVTGIPEAGLPIARAVSELTGIPFLEIFEKSVTPEGRQIIAKKLDIDIEGLSFLVIDDLVTLMLTKWEAKLAADELKAKIISFLVLVDREQGGLLELKNRDRKSVV